MATATRSFRLTLCLAAAIGLAAPASAQTLEDLTADGGTRILRQNGHLDAFFERLEALRPAVTKQPRARVEASTGQRLHGLYRDAWVEYLESQGADPRKRDFLGRPATRVYRLNNLEIWLEHSNRGTGDRHNVDLIVWELDVDSDGKVTRARGVSADLTSRHPLDGYSVNAHRDHFRRKVFAAEAHVQSAAALGIPVELDSHPDRAFYYQDYLLDRGPEHRVPASTLNKDQSWFAEKPGRDRRGMDATRRVLGFTSEGAEATPSRLTSADAEALHSRLIPRLRTSVITAGVALASISTAEASAVMTAVSNPSLKTGRLFRLLLAEDWDRLERLLAQPTISNDVMGELAEAGSYQAVHADTILNYLRQMVRDAKARKRILYFDGSAAQIRLGDGRFGGYSANAAGLPGGQVLRRWGGRLRIPEGCRITGLKLTFAELRGSDRALRVEVGEGDDKTVLFLTNGQNVARPIPVPPDGLVLVKLIPDERKDSWLDAELDDLLVIAPAIEYSIAKPEEDGR